jgi:hypothetical protein
MVLYAVGRPAEQLEGQILGTTQHVPPVVCHDAPSCHIKASRGSARLKISQSHTDGQFVSNTQDPQKSPLQRAATRLEISGCQ